MRTAVFDTIKSLQPYFFSLREIKKNVSLDIRIPLNWRYLDDNPDEIQIKVQDESEMNRLVSIIAESTKEGYDTVFNVAKKIIKVNLEEEEKIKLFNQKVEELKTLFLSSPLDKLKDISFDKKNGIRNPKSAGEIELGDTEGSATN